MAKNAFHSQQILSHTDQPLESLRQQLNERFPGTLRQTSSLDVLENPLRHAPSLWLEIALGAGGLSWLAAWTLLQLALDEHQRPALWVDTHCTLTAGDLLDLEGHLVVVRPADPREAHVAADIALRAGSFALVALEFHHAMHPTALGRLARLAQACPKESPSQLVFWGDAPPFLTPPSATFRCDFGFALSELFAEWLDLSTQTQHTHQADSPLSDQNTAENERHEKSNNRKKQPKQARTTQHTSSGTTEQKRLEHTTNRMRVFERAADRRPLAATAASESGAMAKRQGTHK